MNKKIISIDNVERVDPNMLRFYNGNVNTYMSHTT